MSKEIIVGKNQKRRILSMLGENFSRIKYVLFLALFLAIPVDSRAGTFGLIDTDGTSAQLFAPWDLRSRETFIQVTNTSAAPVTVHVQVFNAAAGCPEIDFYDTYTGNDTHVYNLRGLTRNNGIALSAALPDGGFGIFVVSKAEGTNLPHDADSVDDFVFTANVRIIDAAGYEYRTNVDTLINILSAALDGAVVNFNFNNVNGSNASDVIGIVIADAGDGAIEVNAAPGIAIQFDVDQVDAAENPLSCEDFVFSCSPTNFNVGINDALPNSRIGNRLCPGFSEPVGLMVLDGEGASETANYFTGYVGLNNGDGTGSLDSWWLSLGQNVVLPAVTSGLTN
jgi:hypothetical protein